MYPHATNEIYNRKMELQILELKKLSKTILPKEDIIHWMRFFNGKNKEEFEHMAQTNEYLGEAYEALQRLSADDKKRLEYEARDKALKDYNTQMSSAEKRGIEIGEKHGIEIGEKRGIQLACKVFRLHSQGFSAEEISAECNISAEKVHEIL